MGSKLTEDFLSRRIGKFDGVFCADVYSKPTDAHQYLNFKSCDPPHIRRAIPYGQALRIKRICYSDETFESKLGELKGFLVKRGYNSFDKVRLLDRSALFNQEGDELEEKIWETLLL